MDHGRELNNHERAELARRDEGRTCKLSMHADTIMLVYSLTIVLEILATDDDVNSKFWKLMFACLSFDPNEEASIQTTHLTPLFKKNLKIYNINDANKYC